MRCSSGTQPSTSLRMERCAVLTYSSRKSSRKPFTIPQLDLAFLPSGTPNEVAVSPSRVLCFPLSFQSFESRSDAPMPPSPPKSCHSFSQSSKNEA